MESKRVFFASCSYQREYFELENPLVVELEKVWLNIEQGGLHLIVGVSCKIDFNHKQWSWPSPFWPWPCPYSCGPPKGLPALSTLGIVIMIFVTNNNNLIIATDATLTYKGPILMTLDKYKMFIITTIL